MNENTSQQDQEGLVLIKPPYWAALGGFFFLVMCFFVYAVFGSIPIQISGKGSLVRFSEVVGNVSSTSVSRIHVGMPVEVSIAIADPQLYGRLMGHVSAISHEQVKINLISDPDTVSGYQWTSHKGPPFAIPVGSECTFQVTVERKKPISYLFP